MSYLMNESFNKSKAMSKIIQIMTNDDEIYSQFSDPLEAGKYYHKLQNEKQEAFETLYECMQNMPPLAEILKKYQTTAKELEEISTRIFFNGYSRFYKVHYIPVALISFREPLNFILSNKDIIMLNSKDGFKKRVEIIETAIKLL